MKKIRWFVTPSVGKFWVGVAVIVVAFWSCIAVRELVGALIAFCSVGIYLAAWIHCFSSRLGR